MILVWTRRLLYTVGVWFCFFFVCCEKEEKIVGCRSLFFLSSPSSSPLIGTILIGRTIFWGWQSHRMFISIHTLIWTNEMYDVGVSEIDRQRASEIHLYLVSLFFVRCGNTTTYNQYIMNWRNFSIITFRF